MPSERAAKKEAREKIHAFHDAFRRGPGADRLFSPLDDASQKKREELKLMERERVKLCKRYGVARLGDLVKKPRLMDNPEVINYFTPLQLSVLTLKTEEEINCYWDCKKEIDELPVHLQVPLLPPLSEREQREVDLRENVARLAQRITAAEERIYLLSKTVSKEVMQHLKKEFKQVMNIFGAVGRPVAQSTPLCSVYDVGMNNTTIATNQVSL